jgi:mono/diheme cytochrome c family protein
MKTPFILAVAAFGLLAAGCQKDLKSTRSFRLPEGNAASGQAAFIALNCTGCHTVDGVDLPKPTAAPENILALGGGVPRLRTYGELLTSIIHPNYSLSEAIPVRERKQMARSPMQGVNDIMTVKQLVDLVAFLQPRYRPLEPIFEMEYQLAP